MMATTTPAPADGPMVRSLQGGCWGWPSLKKDWAVFIIVESRDRSEGYGLSIVPGIRSELASFSPLENGSFYFGKSARWVKIIWGKKPF